MSTIWKYKLRVVESQNVEMPVGAKLMAVQTQGDGAVVWALVNPAAKKAVRRILIAGTGHEREDITDATYIGTFQLSGGAFVGHAFDAGVVEEPTDMKTPALEALARDAAEWVGWQYEPGGWHPFDRCVAFDADRIGHADLLDMHYGGALLLSAIKGKCDAPSSRRTTYGTWFASVDDTPRVFSEGATELSAFLLSLHAAGLIRGEG